MISCLNPACPQPQNPENNRFCQGCGSQLGNFDFRFRFRITKLLGEGAFGRTYLALDLDDIDQRLCVLKKFIAQLQGEALKKATQLFELEARQLKNLNHPQIPQLYAYFEQENSLYLVQEYIEGHNLREIHAQQGNFTENQIRELLQELLPLLDYLHTKTLEKDYVILHRDIKPENIMARSPQPPLKRGANGNNKYILVDFGGAKQITGTVLKRPATLIYTPGYAAMEQMTGKPCAASDLYSLGVVCVRLLTGYFPETNLYGDIDDDIFDHNHVQWLWREKLQEQGRNISQDLGKILDKLLENFVINRYQSAKEVLADLNPQTVTIPVKKSPVTPQPISPPVTTPQKSVSGQNLPYQLKSFSFEVITLKKVITTHRSGFLGNQTELRANLQTQTSLGQAEYFTIDLGSNITLDLISIPSGKFLMGSPNNEEKRRNTEIPRHEVIISPFFIGKYPITQEQWEAVMGNNPSRFKGAKKPVEKVSWHDCVAFCEKLSQKIGLNLTLPSEAQWEYACRAGTTTPFHFGETITTDLANYDGNYTYNNGLKGIYRQQTTDVGKFPPNTFGLYDMHGNIWEWCEDDYHSSYNGAPTDDSAWLTGDKNTAKILRGGSWYNVPWYCRSAHRNSEKPDSVDKSLGFRVVCVVSMTP